MTKTTVPLASVHVSLDFDEGRCEVGRLATKDRRIYFEYSASFLKRDLPLSPFYLPVQAGVQSFDPGLFAGGCYIKTKAKRAKSQRLRGPQTLLGRRLHINIL